MLSATTDINKITHVIFIKKEERRKRRINKYTYTHTERGKMGLIDWKKRACVFIQIVHIY